MARLPQVSGREAVAAFQRAGFEIKRQRGSHIAMTKAGSLHTLSIPDHSQIKPGTHSGRRFARPASPSTSSSRSSNKSSPPAG